MVPSRRRWRVIGAIGLTALALVAFAARSGATNVESDSSASALVPQSSASADDWVDTMPTVYYQGNPVQWSSVTTNGVAWTPTIIRILRGQTHFAFFGLPNGTLWASSEDDGTLWRVNDYYDNNSWTLATARDVEASWSYLWWVVWTLVLTFLKALAIIAGVMGLILLIEKIGRWRNGGDPPFDMSATQLTVGGWVDNTSGITDAYYTLPGYADRLEEFPKLPTAAAQLGLITLP